MRSILLFGVVGVLVLGYLYSQGKLGGLKSAATPPAQNAAVSAAQKATEQQKCIDSCDQAAIVDEEGDKKRRECRAKCGVPLPGGGQAAGQPGGGGLSGGATRAHEPVGKITRAPANRSSAPAPASGTTGRITVSGPRATSPR